MEPIEEHKINIKKKKFNVGQFIVWILSLFFMFDGLVLIGYKTKVTDAWITLISGLIINFAVTFYPHLIWGRKNGKKKKKEN